MVSSFLQHKICINRLSFLKNTSKAKILIFSNPYFFLTPTIFSFENINTNFAKFGFLLQDLDLAFSVRSVIGILISHDSFPFLIAPINSVSNAFATTFLKNSICLKYLFVLMTNVLIPLSIKIPNSLNTFQNLSKRSI